MFSPCCAILKAGSGDERPCSRRSWKAVSCRRLSFFSSLLHCCKRLFLTALLGWISSQSLRAASYIFIWSANSASTKLSSDSCEMREWRERDNKCELNNWTLYVLDVYVFFEMTLFSIAFYKCWFYLCSSREALFIKFERSSNTSADLRRLLSWQQRVIIWQPACQLLNHTKYYKSKCPQRCIWIKWKLEWWQIVWLGLSK